MLELRKVVDELEAVRQGLSRRGAEAVKSLDAIAELAARRKAVLQRLEALRAQRNEANASMAKLDKQSDAFKQRRDELKALGKETKELELEQRQVQGELEETLLGVPNIPVPEAPEGTDETSNVEVRRWGSPPVQEFEPKDHHDLGVALGILDFERGAKLSGARFTVLKGLGARLERALMAFMLDLHGADHGYTEIWPPALVKDTSMRGTGQLPKFAADSFRIANWDDSADRAPADVGDKAEGGYDLYLVPTAEVPLTNLHAQEILEPEFPQQLKQSLTRLREVFTAPRPTAEASD